MNCKKLLISLERKDIETLNYFTEKYSSLSVADAFELVKQDPQFKVDSAETQNGIVYKLKLNVPSKVN